MFMFKKIESSTGAFSVVSCPTNDNDGDRNGD